MHASQVWSLGTPIQATSPSPPSWSSAHARQRGASGYLPELLDIVGAILLCLLAEGDEELNLVPGMQVRKVAPIGHRVHVEEDALTGVVLTLVVDEAILHDG